MSAGHNFESLWGNKSTDELKNMSTDDALNELAKYKVWFGNVDGEFPEEVDETKLEKGKAWNLKIFLLTFGFSGSIGCNAMQTKMKTTAQF